MPDVQYGWKCPNCNTMYSPWEKVCLRCSPTPTLSGYSGTVFLGGAFSSGFGTAFYSPPKTEAIQAQKVVSDWRAKGFSAKALISAAVNTLIDDEEDDEA